MNLKFNKKELVANKNKNKIINELSENLVWMITNKKNKEVAFIKKTIYFIILISICIALFFITVLVYPSNISSGNSIIRSFNIGWLLSGNKIIPVTIAAIGLSAGSYIIQQTTKNRLADTSILGISTVNVVVLVIIFTAGVGTTLIFQNLEPWVLMMFSIFVGLIIFYISYKKGKDVSLKFILAGIIINFIFIGVGQTFLNVGKSNEPIFLVQPYLNGQLPLPTISTYQYYCGIAMIATGILWMLFISKKFFINNSNFLISKSLGVKSTWIYLQAIIISCILTAGAFILVGNVSFLGIATANIAFFLFKKRNISGLFCSILCGIAFLLFALFIGNNVVANSFIPANLLIPLFVAPIFIYLAAKRKKTI